MARGAPSPADQKVIDELAVRDVLVTASQLESWRRSGLLPRHRRRRLGRGRGSVVDEIDLVVVESAAALARHTRQGRDRRLAVLAWFAEAGMPRRPGEPVVPEPAAAAVCAAVVWAVATSPSQRLLEMARSMPGGDEEGLEALYAEACRVVGFRPRHAAAHPGSVRAALGAGEELPKGPAWRGMVYLAAAIGVGPEEVGGGLLAEAFAATGMFGLPVEKWMARLGAAERGEGPPVDWSLLKRAVDPLEQVQRASYAELVRARTVLMGLRPFYLLYMFHGIFMPETPALAALRARIDERGLGPLLDHMVSVNFTPREFTDGLVSCLDAMWHELYQALMEQLFTDPTLFRIPGDGTGAAGFMNTWVRALQEQTSTESGPNGSANGEVGEPARLKDLGLFGTRRGPLAR